VVQGMGGLSGYVGDGAAKGSEDGKECGERVGAQLAGALAMSGQGLGEEPCLEPGGDPRHRGDVPEEPLRVGANTPYRVRRRPGWRGAAPSRDDFVAAGLVGAGEDLVHQARRLSAGEPGARNHLRCLLLVATWQPRHGRRGAGRDEAQPDVGLHGLVERLGQEEPAAHPALVARKAASDLRLREPVLPVQRPDEPRLLELGEPAALVQEGDRHLGLDGVHREDLRAQLGPPQRARRTHPLEPVEHLQPARRRREDGDGRDLPHRLERALHAGERGRLAEPQRGQALAELRQLHHALRCLSGLHGGHSSTAPAAAARVARDTLSHQMCSIALSPSDSAAEGGA